jgi:hypothetical protein
LPLRLVRDVPPGSGALVKEFGRNRAGQVRGEDSKPDGAEGLKSPPRFVDIHRPRGRELSLVLSRSQLELSHQVPKRPLIALAPISEKEVEKEGREE